MKRPAPKPPTDAPAGTIWFGGPTGWFSISLIIRGDDLVPENITRLFGTPPSEAYQKGVPIYRNDGTLKRVPKFGAWIISIKREDVDEWDINEATKLLIGRLPKELSVWHKLPMGAHTRLSFGIELTTANQGFDLEPETLRFAAERNIRLDFDIYDPAKLSSGKDRQPVD
jgi:hypothetical protein